MIFLKYTRRGIKNKNKKKIYQNGYIITDKENAEIIDDFSVLVRVTGFEPAASWTPFVWGRLNQIELRPIKCSDFLEKPKIPGVGLARTVKTRCMPELRIFRPSGNLLDEVFDACCYALHLRRNVSLVKWSVLCYAHNKQRHEAGAVSPSTHSPGTLGGQLLFVAPSGEEGRPMVMTYSDFIQTGIFLVALINLVYQIAKRSDRRHPDKYGDHFKALYKGWPLKTSGVPLCYLL